MPLAAAAELLEFDRQAMLAGEIWRLWTGHLVHYSAQHALVDFATVLIASAIVLPTVGWRRLTLLLAMATPLISAGLLLLAPECLHYRGASGIAVMLVVLAARTLWPRSGMGGRTALLLLAVTLLAKIAAEAGGLAAPWSGLPEDVRVVWQAHLLGAIVALTIRLAPSHKVVV